jgi:hypothetical protein
VAPVGRRVGVAMVTLEADDVGRRESLEHQGHREEVRQSLNARIAAWDRPSQEGVETAAAAWTPSQKRVL